jgi:hypothetical protein
MKATSFFMYATFFNKILVALFLFMPLSGCKRLNREVDEFQSIINTTKTETINTLDFAISSLNKNSADWRQTLDQTVKQLTEDAQSILRIEVQNILTTSIALLGVELQCSLDIIGIKAKNSLEKLKARYLELPEPAARPYVCLTIPLSIDMKLDPSRRNNITITGYFDSTDYRILLIKRTRQEVDITRFVSKTSPYILNINLGSNGIELSSSDDKIIMKTGESNIITTINVVQPSAPNCFEGDLEVIPNETANYTLIPKRYCNPCTNPDLEWGNSTVTVFYSVRLEAIGRSVYAHLNMRCNEQGGDKSYVNHYERIRIHTLPADQIALGFGQDVYFEEQYLNTLTDEPEPRNARGPVQQFLFYIRTRKGIDINSYTRVNIAFNRLKIRVRQVGNCK